MASTFDKTTRPTQSQPLTREEVKRMRHLVHTDSAVERERKQKAYERELSQNGIRPTVGRDRIPIGDGCYRRAVMEEGE